MEKDAEELYDDCYYYCYYYSFISNNNKHLLSGPTTWLLSLTSLLCLTGLLCFANLLLSLTSLLRSLALSAATFHFEIFFIIIYVAIFNCFITSYTYNIISIISTC